MRATGSPAAGGAKRQAADAGMKLPEICLAGPPWPLTPPKSLLLQYGVAKST
jgi:hypothetical protein